MSCERRSSRSWPTSPRGPDPVRIPVPDPGAIYTIGRNYVVQGETRDDIPARPLVYGKAATSIVGDGETVTWDRQLSATVDAEVELGVVMGRHAWQIAADEALDHVLGYTIVNDVSSRDPWLDGDQWLIGKSMPGFCPAGPVVVTPDELDPANLRLGCTINGVAIQDGITADMRFSIAEVIEYLSRHLVLRPGDLIATGTPPRLPAPLGPDRHLEPGDVVICWIEGIGELTTRIR
jgi:2-keto-4-pentenoate hydratase/2-oxohepta-3-ene-1,7-dioic acid hydratase in catechol pathway